MERWATFLVSWSLPGVPLAILTAIYTGYLFAQAKARDMWQNPLLPPHLLVQAVLLGSAVLLPASFWFLLTFDSIRPLMFVLAISSIAHLLMVWGEVSLVHPTAHARLAIWEMTRGRYRQYFWWGMLLSILGALIPTVLLYWQSPQVAPNASTMISGVAALLALAGVMLYEHAYVQAGQSVPLA
jgi:Ni/Fe-hydrogenase subunit HybB-like protein